MPSRFRTAHERLEDFSSEALVICPRCSRCALVRLRETDASPPVLLTCSNCGYSQAWTPTRAGILHSTNPARWPGHVIFGPPVDPYFRLPLWLRARCCGEVLWAYNAVHLQWLEEYIGAPLRERARGEYGWSNQSLASRLPQWMRSAKNRAEILRCIQALKQQV